MTPKDRLTVVLKGTKLTDCERKLLDVLRQIPYGEVVVFMQGGQPVRVERVKESIKLT